MRLILKRKCPKNKNKSRFLSGKHSIRLRIAVKDYFGGGKTLMLKHIKPSIQLRIAGRRVGQVEFSLQI